MYQVTNNEHGYKLVDFLNEKLEKEYSLRKIKQAIESNYCRVNGSIERFYTHRLTIGDHVHFDLADMRSLKSTKQVAEKQRILFEDDDLLFYNKPPGITSDASGLGSLFPDYELVHRLDKETTGVILFAKSESFNQKMIELFKDNRIEKVYLALVDGIPRDKKGSIANCLGRISRSAGNAKWGIVSRKRGQYAKTIWNIEKKGFEAALIRCVPLTGRTHQIRIHMREIGHPILGDFKYTKEFKCSYAAKRTLLHAYELTFIHPSTGKSIYVKAPVPADFKAAMKKVL